MKIIFSLFIIFSISSSFSQILKGKVFDKNGNTLYGVNVSNEILNKNTSTDFDGSFSIDANEGDNLKFSMIGYNTANRKAEKNMIVTLSVANQELTEIVVIGYGTRKKAFVTGAVSQIKSSEILKTPAQSAIQSLQGRAAGVNIVTNDEPGAKPTITIRGLGTIAGPKNPLYVIDGIESESLNGISANDIETIDLLKDASSTAIYGQKGANGVVLITTKKGKSGAPKVDFNTSVGFSSILKKLKVYTNQIYKIILEELKMIKF